MKTFLFDCQGTLVGNSTVSEEDMKKVLLVLKSAGHRIVIWSGSGSNSVPKDFAALADDVWSKNADRMASVNSDFIVFDDDTLFLTVLARRGAKIVGALQMGDWLVNEVWKVEKEDPITNLNLSATREQQAQRVRNAFHKLNKFENRAVLKRTLKHQGDISRTARLCPMYRIYQVHPLALEDLTYAGSIGFIMSYLENGNVTFSVFYDRPGHPYTPVGARAEIPPEWIKPISIEDFEELVKQDNPAIVFSGDRHDKRQS